MTDNELNYRTVSQCISSDYCRGWNEAVTEAIDLINRQNAEIENRYKRESYLFRKIHERDSEIARLKTEKDNLIKTYKECMTEAINECIEMVKSKSSSVVVTCGGIVVAGSTTYTISEITLYNILKEMTEGKK